MRKNPFSYHFPYHNKGLNEGSSALLKPAAHAKRLTPAVYTFINFYQFTGENSSSGRLPETASEAP